MLSRSFVYPYYYQAMQEEDEGEECASLQAVESNFNNLRKNEGKAMKSHIRFTYNATPSTKQLADQAVLPNSFHYTPLDEDSKFLNHILKEGVNCKKCGAFINRHCKTYPQKKLWVCCICWQPNEVQCLPKELLKSETYELTLKNPDQQRNYKVYIFVVDLCIAEKELSEVKSMLIEFVLHKFQEEEEEQSVTNLIYLITFSKFVFCYDFRSEINTVTCLGATQQYEREQLLNFLNCNEKDLSMKNKFFVSISDNKQKIIHRIQKLKAQGEVANQQNAKKRSRAQRCYGQAIDVAISLAQMSYFPCRIISTVGGPCTYGVGQVISTNFHEQMRSIKQLQDQEDLKYFKQARAFYSKLKNKIVAVGTVLDSFIFSVEETGMTQMYDLIETSGGLLVLGQEFSGSQQIFSKSFKKAYIEDVNGRMPFSLGSSAMINIFCSSDISINGSLGNCTPIPHSSKSKYAWFLNGIDCQKSITFLYELTHSTAKSEAYFIQITTKYLNYWNELKMRVTTVKREWKSSAIVGANFDQQSAIVTMAKFYFHRSLREHKRNVRTELDKLLIKWTANFAKYSKGNEQSFVLPSQMNFLPQYVYYLRRTPLFNKTRISLDELFFQFYTFNREKVSHCILMIEPALLSYSIENINPTPVKLIQTEMKDSVILLLDTYFNVVLWSGETIEYWKEANFDKKEEYAHVKNLFESPEQDIEYLINSRFPCPSFYRTRAGDSKERFLKSKVSSTGQNQNMISEESSLDQFMTALISIVVNQRTK